MGMEIVNPGHVVVHVVALWHSSKILIRVPSYASWLSGSTLSKHNPKER